MPARSHLQAASQATTPGEAVYHLQLARLAEPDRDDILSRLAHALRQAGRIHEAVEIEAELGILMARSMPTVPGPASTGSSEITPGRLYAAAMSLLKGLRGLVSGMPSEEAATAIRAAADFLHPNPTPPYKGEFVLWEDAVAAVTSALHNVIEAMAGQNTDAGMWAEHAASLRGVASMLKD